MSYLLVNFYQSKCSRENDRSQNTLERRRDTSNSSTQWNQEMCRVSSVSPYFSYPRSRTTRLNSI